MAIENIPEIYLDKGQLLPELFVYDFKMIREVLKSKVNLGMHMFSFLQVGKKQVHFAGKAVAVNKKQSLLLKKGNWLWTELLDDNQPYYCKLLFFSDDKLLSFLDKYVHSKADIKEQCPYFIIQNDAYISSYLNSLSTLTEKDIDFRKQLYALKFEELMLYLLQKYGDLFVVYLQSLIISEVSPLKKVVERTVYHNLKLEELSFLCHMSLSTFKRAFVREYNAPPGKWLQNKRLQKAKEMLEEGSARPSDIYFQFGYNNLSNFSAAFKKKFGYPPKECSS